MACASAPGLRRLLSALETDRVGGVESSTPRSMGLAYSHTLSIGVVEKG